MQGISAAEYGIEAKLDATTSEVQYGWQLAIKKFGELKEAKTPREMLRCVMNAIEVVKQTYDLFRKNIIIAAEELVRLLPYLFVKANIPRALAIWWYL